MKIGNVSINPEAFKEYTKEQFCNEFRGKLDIDKEHVWEMVQRFNKTVDESLEKIETQFMKDHDTTNTDSAKRKKSDSSKSDRSTGKQ